MKDFYDKTSYGALNLVAARKRAVRTTAIVGWLTMPGNHPNFGGSIGASAQALAQTAMTAAAHFIDYAAFDTNGNGFVSESELLIIVVAGNEGSFGACSPQGIHELVGWLAVSCQSLSRHSWRTAPG